MAKAFERCGLVAMGVASVAGYACSSSRAPEPSGLANSPDENTSGSSAGTNTSNSASFGSGPMTPSTTGQNTSVAPEPGTDASSQSSSDSPPQMVSTNADSSTIDDPSDEVSEATSSNTSAAEPTIDEPFSGTCTVSEPVGMQRTGSGPHDVIVETNSDPGINEGTIYRPADLGGNEKYPIFVWGEGGCSQDGLSNANALVEIASHGYFVIADGTPNGSGNRAMDRSDLEAMGAPLLAYVDWAIAENEKPCSVYHQSLDTVQVASNGFSCGGLMAQGTVLDPRIVTWGVTSSGMAGATQEFYDAIHTPVLFVEGGPEEVAYEGGLQGYETITGLGVPVMWFDKALGHGGDLFDADGGDFTRINLAWLNWWLKGDVTATGKGLLVGAECSYCTDSDWDVRSANIP